MIVFHVLFKGHQRQTPEGVVNRHYYYYCYIIGEQQRKAPISTFIYLNAVHLPLPIATATTDRGHYVHVKCAAIKQFANFATIFHFMAAAFVIIPPTPLPSPPPLLLQIVFVLLLHRQFWD